MEGRLRHLVTILAPCAGASVLLATGLGAAGAKRVRQPVCRRAARAAKGCLRVSRQRVAPGEGPPGPAPVGGPRASGAAQGEGDRPLRALLAYPLRPGVRVDLHRRGLRGRQLDGRRESRLGCRRSRLRGASLRGAARFGVAQGELPAPRLEGRRHLPVAGNALRARSGGPLGDRLREPLLAFLRQAPRDQLHDGGRFSRKARRPS